MNIDAFLDSLANARSDASFARTAAGLTSLQAYDSIRANGFDPFVHEAILDRIALDIESIPVGTSARVALDSVIQALPFWDTEGTIRIGHRSVYTALLNYGQTRGDFPAGKRLLARTAHRARHSCPTILPRVTVAMAGLANAAGEYERAIQITFDLLQTVARDDEVRYQALVDLAAYLVDYGLPSVAAKALRLVEAAAPEAGVRRHAQLNRFFLAAHHDTEQEFTASYAAFSEEVLAPRQQTQLALFAAQGYRRFSRFDSAQTSAEHALVLAKQYEFFQLVFEAETELHEIEAARTVDAIPLAPASVPPARKRRGKTLYRSTTGARPSPRIRRVAESLENMARHLGSTDGL